MHSQQPGGSAAAVAGEVDSLEHGMCLDPDLLPQMAAQGTALTPTLNAITGSIDDVERQRPDGPQQGLVPGRRERARRADARPPRRA